MPDSKDFSSVSFEPVHDNVWRCDEFARTLALAGSAEAWELFKLSNAVQKGLRKSACGIRVLLDDSIYDSFELIDGG